MELAGAYSEEAYRDLGQEYKNALENIKKKIANLEESDVKRSENEN